MNNKCVNCGSSISRYGTRCHSCENKRKYKFGLIGYKGKLKEVITKDILIELYEKQGKNIKEIAKILKCGHSSIHNYLKKFNISINAFNRNTWINSHIGRNNCRYGKAPIFKKIKYSDIWFKSSWEMLFYKWCLENNIKSLYESKTFDLGRCTYTPDFYLPEFNLYIEVKGHWFKDAKVKFELFKKIYCGIQIKIVDKKELKSIGVIK